MVTRQRFSLTRQDKKLMVGGLGVALLALILFLTLPALVDTNAIQNQIKTSFKSATGLDLEIQDGLEVSIFPTPHVRVKNLYVANIPGASSSFMISVRSLDMKLHTTSLFSSSPTADSISMDGVVFNLERMKNGRLNWQEVKQYTSKNAVRDVAQSDDPAAVQGDESESSADGDTKKLVNLDNFVQGLSKVSRVNLTNAHVHFTDYSAGIASHYTDIKVDFFNDRGAKRTKLIGSLYYDGVPANINAEIGDIEESYKLKITSAKLRLESGQTFFEYEGDVGFSETVFLKGKTVFESSNLIQWIKLLNAKEGVSEKLPAGAKPVPLKLTSDVTTEGNRILLPSISVEGGVFAGKLNAVIKQPINIEIKGDLDTVDMDTIAASGILSSPSGTQKKKITGSDESGSVSLNLLAQKSLLSYLAIAVDIRIADISYNKQRIKKGHVEFDMTDGDMAISKISGTFPGNSKLLFTGLGKEGYQGFMIDGQLDGSGENVVDMISFFRSGGTISLPKDFKRFRFKANMVVSAKELRFTEISSRIENMAFVGGIITTMEDRVKVQAAMRVGGIDADRLLQAWSLNKFLSSMHNVDMGVVKAEDDFSKWLQNVDYELDVRISAEQYILNGKPQEKAKFRASIAKNKLIVSELETLYDGTQFSGKVLLDVAGKQPFIDADLALDTIDFSAHTSQKSFIFESDATDSSQKGTRKWSRQGISFGWMDFVNATLRLRLGHIKAGDIEATSVDIKANIEDRTLSLPQISGSVLGAQFTGKGFIKNGTIPSLSLTGDIVDLDIPYLNDFMPALKGMSGRVNSHFRLNTSGIDVYTWLYNMQGSIVMAARETIVDGFNLPGIVNAVGYVRTVVDILDAVKRAFPGGSTVFTSMDGEMTIGNGILRFPTSSLKNDLADGEFVGQIDLINWKMVGNLMLSITYLDRVTPPKMAISYRGNLDEVEKELDTRLLEQYVANKTSEKLLQTTEP